MDKKSIVIFVIIICGFMFRLWFQSLVPQPHVYDQTAYERFAGMINDKFLAVYPLRSYGLPMIYAPLFRIFGSRQDVWILGNAFMDTLTLILVYLIAGKIFRDRLITYSATIIYAFNIFSSGYVGVMLTEIPAILFVTLFAYLIISDNHKSSVARGVAIGITAGFLPQIRPTYLYWSGAVFVYFLYSLLRYNRFSRNAIRIAVFSITALSMPFLYSSAANYRNYGTPTAISIDNIMVRELYTSLFVTRSLPTGEDQSYWQWPNEVVQAWMDYEIPGTARDRENRKIRYAEAALKIIRYDPRSFVVSRLQKAWFVWEKHYVFPYRLGWTAAGHIVITVYIVNLLYLSAAVSGLILWRRSNRTNYGRRFYWLTLSLVAYITLVHTVSTAEERYTLPAYALLAVWAGYGSTMLLKKIGLRFRK